MMFSWLNVGFQSVLSSLFYNFSFLMILWLHLWAFFSSFDLSSYFLPREQANFSSTCLEFSQCYRIFYGELLEALTGISLTVKGEIQLFIFGFYIFALGLWICGGWYIFIPNDAVRLKKGADIRQRTRMGSWPPNPNVWTLLGFAAKLSCSLPWW
jgi:hypothetical protein